MPTFYHHHLHLASEEERSYLESLIREDYERCHPGETLEDLKRRASFSKEDRGLLQDWMAVAATRVATDQAKARHARIALPRRGTPPRYVAFVWITPAGQRNADYPLVLICP